MQTVVVWAVRPAEAGAAEEIARLHRRVARVGFAHIFPAEAPPPTYEEDLARWERWLGPDRDQGRHGFVVHIKGHIVGVVLAGPDPDDPALGHLSRLYVDPEQWGSGIGTALYDAAIDDLLGRGFPAATLWVLEGNVRARRWYERLGWVETAGKRPVYEPAGIYDTQYVLALDADGCAQRKDPHGTDL